MWAKHSSSHATLEAKSLRAILGLMPEVSQSDHVFMSEALEEAREAAERGEVPIGAVIVHRGEIIARGQNRVLIATSDPTAHAEIVALRQATGRAKNYRLPGATLYVTLEPCAMCAGAIVSARIERLVFAARDLRFGAVRSKFRLADSDLLNHRVAVEEGLLAADATEMLSRFFNRRRD